MSQTLKQNWFSNVRGGLLTSLAVTLALIPEAITSPIIIRIDSKIGLHTSFSTMVVIVSTGGRSGMIPAAIGVTAPLMVSLVKDHGLQYLLTATLFCGVLQILTGYLCLGSLICFVSCSVVTGFVDTLAILIFTAQLPKLTDVGWLIYAMIAAGLAIAYDPLHLPRIGRLPPPPLVCILVLIGISTYLGLDTRTVGDIEQLPDSLPLSLRLDVPLDLDTPLIILSYSAVLAVTGFLESLMATTIADEMTDTGNDKDHECGGQGLADIATGLSDGMAGCATIGQSVINAKFDGCSRLSILVASVTLLLMVVFLSDWVGRTPMAALVAVTIMVSTGTSHWESIRSLKRYPLSTNPVMLVTIGVVLATHSLAFGTVADVLLVLLLFTNRIGYYPDTGSERFVDGTHRHYQASEQVFFAPFGRFVAASDLEETLEHMLINLRYTHLWGVTAVVVLDEAVLDSHQHGIQADVLGLNVASATPVDRFGTYDKLGAVGVFSDH